MRRIIGHESSERYPDPSKLNQLARIAGILTISVIATAGVKAAHHIAESRQRRSEEALLSDPSPFPLEVPETAKFPNV